MKNEISNLLKLLQPHQLVEKEAINVLIDEQKYILNDSSHIFEFYSRSVNESIDAIKPEVIPINNLDDYSLLENHVFALLVQ